MGTQETIKNLKGDYSYAVRDLKSLKKQLVRQRMKAKRARKPKYSRTIKVIDIMLQVARKQVEIAKKLPLVIR